MVYFVPDSDYPSQCPWYDCTVACKHWRKGILEACVSRGWSTPSTWILLRNRITRRITVNDTVCGYPDDSHFCPPEKIATEATKTPARDAVPPTRVLELMGHRPLFRDFALSLSIPAMLWLTTVHGFGPVYVRETYRLPLIKYLSRCRGHHYGQFLSY